MDPTIPLFGCWQLYSVGPYYNREIPKDQPVHSLILSALLYLFPRLYCVFVNGSLQTPRVHLIHVTVLILLSLRNSWILITVLKGHRHHITRTSIIVLFANRLMLIEYSHLSTLFSSSSDFYFRCWFHLVISMFQVTEDGKYCLVLVFEAKALQLSDFEKRQVKQRYCKHIHLIHIVSQLIF